MHARAVAAGPLIALAGLTTTAAAQNIGTVTATASAATVSVGETFTIGVVVDDNGESANGVVIFDLLVAGSGAAFTTVPDSLSFHPLVGLVGGAQINPNGAQAAGAHRDLLGPTIDPPLNGLAVFSFQATATETGQIDFQALDGLFEERAIRSIIHGIVTLPQDYDQIIFESVTVNVIPSPSAAVSFALAIPLATLRRR